MMEEESLLLLFSVGPQNSRASNFFPGVVVLRLLEGVLLVADTLEAEVVQEETEGLLTPTPTPADPAGYDNFSGVCCCCLL